ncbi:hypothetical protein [Actinoplanes couchii]|uniref:Uncharacterized protein n=1 Tax=Actinoplanes couchii TaxID=403638 RepID=A0ABQ3XS68_9ACTN|nr:hypothetical protein [Actinoplanes couchii]MDR6317940.1 hypothetical protein [Actinoplanes couchii]GID61349.1 hypothetical protein Aco03nite_097530 [Actinoplanes couchii]
MPLPPRIRLDDPEFWRIYLFEEDPSEDAPIVVEFPVGGDYALVLDIALDIPQINLEIRVPDSAEKLELAWDDQVNWHPDALRWTELDLIARATARLDPVLRHPGPVLALASRFVILGPDTDLDAVTPLMDAAAGPSRTRDWRHRADGRHNGITWASNEAGAWTVEQDESKYTDRALYSTRTPNGDFPLAAWQQLLTAAESTLATATALPNGAWADEEHTKAPRGSLIAARSGPSPLQNSRRHLLKLRLPTDNRPESYAQVVTANLDHTLRTADRGRAESSSYIMIPGEGRLSAAVTITVIDDVEAALPLIREVLSRHDADPRSHLSHNGNQLSLL